MMHAMYNRPETANHIYVDGITAAMGAISGVNHSKPVGARQQKGSVAVQREWILGVQLWAAAPSS